MNLSCRRCAASVTLSLIVISCGEPQPAETACEVLDGAARVLCASAVRERVAAHAIDPGEARLRAIEPGEIEALAEAAALMRSEVEVLCKVRRAGRIDCASVSSLLARLNGEAAKIVVRDIDAVANAYDLGGSVALKCANGAWTDLHARGIDATNRMLSEVVVARMRRACAEAEQVDSDWGVDGPASGAISGVTGIDAFPSACGLQLDEASDTQQLVEDALRYARVMMTQCDTTIAPVEGETTDPIEPSGDTTSEEWEEIEDNGDGTETVTGMTEDGEEYEYVRYRSDSTKPYARIERRERADGSVWTRKTRKTGGAVDRLEDSRGNWIERDQLPSGLSIDRDSRGNYTPLSRDGFWGRRPEDCAHDWCATCKDFAEYFRTLLSDCGGSDLEACRAFGAAAECCAHPEAVNVDPRIVIPNQAGDMVCYGVPGDEQQAKCNVQCSVASHPDCQRLCMATVMSDFEFSLLDQICLYARSEACFQSTHGPAGPGDGRGSSGVTPPLPYSSADFFLE